MLRQINKDKVHAYVKTCEKKYLQIEKEVSKDFLEVIQRGEKYDLKKLISEGYFDPFYSTFREIHTFYLSLINELFQEEFTPCDSCGLNSSCYLNKELVWCCSICDSEYSNLFDDYPYYDKSITVLKNELLTMKKAMSGFTVFKAKSKGAKCARVKK